MSAENEVRGYALEDWDKIHSEIYRLPEIYESEDEARRVCRSTQAVIPINADGVRLEWPDIR
jgi:hypothetical protein